MEAADEPYYLLFGFDGNTGIQRRKLVDVLTFRAGKPAFGAKPGFKKDGFKKKFVGKAAGAKGSYKGGKAERAKRASKGD